MSRLLVIESHPDDLLISAHEYLVKCVAEFDRIVWLSVTLPRQNATYPLWLGIGEVMALHMSDDGKREDAKLYYKKYMVKHSLQQVCSILLANPYYAHWVIDCYRKLRDLIDQLKPTHVLSCLGLKHVTHMLTAMALQKVRMRYRPRYQTQYYVDHPYDCSVSGNFMKEDTIATRNLRLLWRGDRGPDLPGLMKKHYPTEWFFSFEQTFRPVEIYG